MLRHVLLILFISVLFAAALTGPSEWLHDRIRLPRALAAVLIYLLVFAVLVGIGWLVVPPLLGQVAEFADRAPEYADRYQGIREAYGNLRADFPALRRPALQPREREPRPGRRPRRRASGRPVLALPRPAQRVRDLAAPRDEPAADPGLRALARPADAARRRGVAATGREQRLRRRPPRRRSVAVVRAGAGLFTARCAAAA